MKRILALLMFMVLVLSMAACTAVSEQDKHETNSKPANQGQPPQSGEPDDGQKPNGNEPEITYQKLEGRITGASAFNDGYALVCVNGNKDTTYCIDKEGNIIYQIDKKFVVNGSIYLIVVNGYLITDGTAIYDMTGTATRAEDVGATKFYSIALEGGYILAEKVTADYSSTKKEIGVLNFNYEWVVEPSEEIYTAIESDISSLTALNHGSYYHNGYIYFEHSDCYLNIETGEISYDIGQKTPSEYWARSNKGKYFDKEKNIVLDISNHENIKLVGKFQNGKAPIVFHNAEAGAWFFTLVDELGNFQFDPIQVKDMQTVGKVCYDGEYLLLASESSGSDIKLQCYNSNGELLGSMNTDTLDYMSYSAELADGVIMLRGGYNYAYKCYYYNSDFTPLF